jgi:hypothetical protein
MHEQKRMSPLTALFLGLFGVIGVGIASGTVITVFGLQIIDEKAGNLIGLTENTIGGLPELLESLPPVVGELLNDHRAPDYTASIDVDVNLIADKKTNAVRPVLTVTNNGDEVVSMLAVRVAVLNDDGVPLGDWTQVVATPIAIEGDWRGPMFPGATRHVVCSRYAGGRSVSADLAVTAQPEISELRVWRPSEGWVRTAAAD